MTELSSETNAVPWDELLTGLRRYAVFAISPEGVIDSWNEGVRELLGYEELEFLGQNANIIFTAEDRDALADAREFTLARDDGEVTEARWHLRKDGSRVWSNGVLRCTRNDQGVVVGYMKIMRDMTENRTDAMRLLESEERFSKAFNSSPMPIAILELPRLQAVEVNVAFGGALLKGSTVLGQALEDICFEAKEGAFDQVRYKLAEGRSASAEMTFPRKGAEQGFGTLAFEPIELGGKAHAVMFVTDVTEQRNANAQLEQQKQFVNAILSSLPGVFYVTNGHRLVQWNDELERVTGLSGEELAIAKSDDVILEAEKVREQIDTVLKSGHASIEGHLRTKGGALVPYLLTARRVMRAGEALVLGVGIDRTEQVEARRGYDRLAREQSVVADLAASAFSAEGLDQVLDLAARRVAETLMAEHVHIVETKADNYVLRAAIDRDGAATAKRTIANEALAERARFAANDGETSRWPAELLTPLGLHGGIHALIRGHEQSFGFIEALSDRADAFETEDERFLRSLAYFLAAAVEQFRLNRELEHRADHDSLTGLLTRSAFELRLEGALAQAERNRSKVAVLFIDLDRFKSVNDSLGHQAGDEVLRNVALRLRETVRSWDVTARLGGDEFVLFMPDIESSTEIVHVTKRLLVALEAPFAIGGRELRISTTVGVAVFPDDGKDVRTLMQAADAALYEGKARGRNTFHFFTREQHERAMERLELETRLRTAIERNAFQVVFQPQVDFALDAVTVVEALMRWEQPDRTNFAPSKFMPLADAIGLAVPLGEWAIRYALDEHVGWRGTPGAPLRVAINVSPGHFIQPSFPAALLELARAAGAEPDEIEIEFTEETLLRDPILVTRHLNSLKEHRVGIVLDDFGTHAAPLAGLQFLPIDRLKVNETFTHQLHEPRGRRLVESIVQIALSLDICPVAEGIETSEQDAVAREVGFKAAQGHYYQAPSAREQLFTFLAARHTQN